MKLWVLLGVLVIAFVLQTNIVSAQGIHKTEVSIDSNGDAFVRNLFSIDSTNRTEFFVPLINPRDVVAYDSQGDLIISMSGEDAIVSLRSQELAYSFTVDYATYSLTSKNGSEWTFSYNFYKTGEFDSSEFTLVLPPDSRLLSFSPSGVVYSEDGRIHIDLDISPENPVTSIEASYTFSPGPPQQEELPLETVLAVIVMVVVLIAAGILVFRKRGAGRKKTIKKKEPQEPAKDILTPGQKDILKTLSVNEEKIVRELVKNKEGITQKKLMAEIGIPKATLSRTLKKLEIKHVVEIKDYGVTNKIFISQWFLDK